MPDGGCSCRGGITCVGCGAPVLVESSARLAGGLLAHHGCVGLFGLSGLVHDARAHGDAAMDMWAEGRLAAAESLRQALVVLEDLRGDVELTSSQRRSLRRIGLYTASALTRISADTK